jgi:hypothetical protein
VAVSDGLMTASASSSLPLLLQVPIYSFNIKHEHLHTKPVCHYQLWRTTLQPVWGRHMQAAASAWIRAWKDFTDLRWIVRYNKTLMKSDTLVAVLGEMGNSMWRCIHTPRRRQRRQGARAGIPDHQDLRRAWEMGASREA